MNLYRAEYPESDPFRGVMIEDCFVYGWDYDGSSLVVDLDFSLWPAHADYEEHSSDEWTCYKRGVLIAHNPKWLSDYVRKTVAPSTIDPDGSIDYGCLDSINIKGGRIEIWGPFGGLVSSAEKVVCKIQKKKILNTPMKFTKKLLWDR